MDSIRSVRVGARRKGPTGGRTWCIEALFVERIYTPSYGPPRPLCVYRRMPTGRVEVISSFNPYMGDFFYISFTIGPQDVIWCKGMYIYISLCYKEREKIC